MSHLNAVSKSGITPVLELHPHDLKTVSVHADSVCEDLAAAWGVSDPLFLDTIWHHGDAGNPATIAAVFNAARANGLLAIPVVRTTYDAPTLLQIRAVIDEDGRGCMLRIAPSSLGLPTTIAGINAVLAELDLSPGQVHLLLDYKGKLMQLPSDVPLVPHIHDWLTFSASAGVFPRSLITFAQGLWHSLARGDWTSWQTSVVSGGLSRRPAFGDYTVRDPGAPADFGDPIVNVRYAEANVWHARVGGKFKLGLSGDMKPICQSLITQTFYSGIGFSAGDVAYNAAAQPFTQVGGPTQWVQWSVSHHLEYLNHQIQTHPAL